jgi:hypothetical protein
LGLEVLFLYFGNTIDALRLLLLFSILPLPEALERPVVFLLS